MISAMRPVPRTKALTADEFATQFVRPARPVIIAGAIDAWPARQKWSSEYLRDTFGHRSVPAIRDKPGVGQFDPHRGVHYEPVVVRDYVERVNAGDTSLYMAFRVHEQLPELFDDIRTPTYCAHAPWVRSRFWYGAAGIKGVLHHDLPENLYAQIMGRKRFVLIDKWQSRCVYSYPPWSGVPNYSRVDAENPATDQYPRFVHAERWVADLEPGELLYIPSLWWHQARSLETSMSINLWWAEGLLYGIVRAAEIFQRIRKLEL